MGKLINYLVILIFIDMFFIATGQTCNQNACSLNSILFNAIINLTTLNASQFFSQLIGDATNFAGSLFSSSTGILSLFVASAVTIGSFLFSSSDTRLFLPLAATFALISNDFIFISSRLVQISPVLALFIMAPLVLIYLVTVVEWLRGKD